jgi:hypothetical protein
VARIFRLNTVNGDGSSAEEKLIAFEVIDPATSKPYVDDAGAPSVVITLRPISQAKYRQVEAANTEKLLNKKSRAMEDVTDWAGVQDALIDYSVKSWTGILGADDEPLQCVLDAKLGLPGDLKNELIQRAMQGESVEVKAASFRATA